MVFYPLIVFLKGIDSVWQDWGPWSECSTSCGKGFNFRARACGEPAFEGNDTCDGNPTESRECLTAQCPGNNLFSC